MMISQRHIILVLMLILGNFMIFAQNIDISETENGVNIIERIEEESNGLITISIPNEVYELVTESNQETLNKRNHKTVGYRIQVFSDGRNQHSLEARANERGNIIVARFPKYKGEVYTFSKVPNWYTRIGNFETITEANEALKELKKTFPGFANEMRTVKSYIVVKK